MNKVFIVMIIVFGLMSNDASAKKKLYKWVDENGNISYSDQVPPSQIDKKHEELNNQGVVLEKVDTAKTKEQFAAEKAERKRLAELKKEEERKQLIRDSILKTYTNEQEITRLKEERLASLERNIEIANQSLVFQKESKEQLLSIAADSERNGKPISNVMKSRIRIIGEKMAYQYDFIKSKKSEIKTVTEKFEKDLKIFRDARKYSRVKSVIKEK